LGDENTAPSGSEARYAVSGADTSTEQSDAIDDSGGGGTVGAVVAGGRPSGCADGVDDGLDVVGADVAGTLGAVVAGLDDPGGLFRFFGTTVVVGAGVTVVVVTGTTVVVGDG
jgi:hypothetical protein